MFILQLGIALLTSLAAFASSPSCSFRFTVDNSTCFPATLSDHCSAITNGDSYSSWRMRLLTGYVASNKKGMPDFMSTFEPFGSTCHTLILAIATNPNDITISMCVPCFNPTFEFMWLVQILPMYSCATSFLHNLPIYETFLPFTTNTVEGHIVGESYFLLRSGLSYLLFVEEHRNARDLEVMKSQVQNLLNQTLKVNNQYNHKHCSNCSRQHVLVERMVHLSQHKLMVSSYDVENSLGNFHLPCVRMMKKESIPRSILIASQPRTFLGIIVFVTIATMLLCLLCY